MIINSERMGQEELCKIRRDLHQIPELGLHLPKTCAYVADKLKEMDIPYVLLEQDCGIMATIRGAQPGKTIALRADMDALPIQEETGAQYASVHPGIMHACGHDAHAAMLLGAARMINEHRSALKGTVRILFQTGEETARGARFMLDNGALEGADSIFGIHIGSILSKDIPTGKIVASPGCCMASCDRFEIHVHGNGCHGSTPEKGIDPVNIAAHIVLALQTINSREFNACVPVVVTIGSIHGGSEYNIIPEEVTLVGTIRTLDESVRRQVARRIDEISRGTASAFGGTAEVEMVWGAGSVVNDPDMAALAAAAASEIVGWENVITQVEHPNMGGEDFAHYLEKIPGALLFLSSSNPEKKTDIPHHNPKFDVDEDVLWIGAGLYAAVAEAYLNR